MGAICKKVLEYGNGRFSPKAVYQTLIPFIYFSISEVFPNEMQKGETN